MLFWVVYFMKEDWLHLTWFSFIEALVLSTFDSFKEMYLNFSNSSGWTFWVDNSWRSILNDALSKWLKSLYWIILGLCFAWKTFETVNVNLWKSDRPFSKTLDEWKLFGWFVKMWPIHVGFSRFLKEVSCFIKFLRLWDAQNSSK